MEALEKQLATLDDVRAMPILWTFASLGRFLVAGDLGTRVADAFLARVVTERKEDAFLCYVALSAVLTLQPTRLQVLARCCFFSFCCLLLVVRLGARFCSSR